MRQCQPSSYPPRLFQLFTQFAQGLTMALPQLLNNSFMTSSLLLQGPLQL